MNANDQYHEQCTIWLLSVTSRTLVVSTLVVAETCYWLHKDLGNDAEVAFLEQLAREQQFELYAPDRPGLARMAALVARYPRLGGSDASVIVAAEQLGTIDVATVDRRDFPPVKPAHAEYLNLLPAGFVP
ncbi:PIN domain-containing protein [Amycolatopsis rubida]|uniref:PIN domain-containing protein n=1 Tax=Amycolatopsis rubida TaxID=112413 RepID=A0ABX0C6A9_9PSEU|nr:PIN domain-containing protein [Amycolatopsis rubida]NEC62187.1 PIN domain-containing protein [Amycolatopsis rubida]